MKVISFLHSKWDILEYKEDKIDLVDIKTLILIRKMKKSGILLT